MTGQGLSGQLKNGLHRMEVRVYYEDTDFSGVVYHANYLRFAERGRSEMLHACGIHHADLEKRETPLAFAIVKMDLDFIAPARIDDVLEVHTVYYNARGARLQIRQVITRQGVAIWRADILAACIDHASNATRLPPDVMAAIEPHIGQPELLPG
jgi:acyl-CoA thioester hydrolase